MPTPGNDAAAAPGDVTIRTGLRPGDIGEIVRLHGLVYASEYGFDETFEAYVAGPLAAFILRGDAVRERLWIAERAGQLVGCVAVAAAGDDEPPGTAQLRWLLVTPDARGAGLGRRLLEEAVTFSRACGYRRIVLWTVAALTTAARLYRAAGFGLAEERPGRRWGVGVIEEKHELWLA